jgi:hypothetical protein
MIGIVGSNGLIGSYLKTVVPYTHLFNSNNVNEIVDYKFDIVYISAPSSNRLQANADPENDLENIQNLFNSIKNTSINSVILISTVDTVLRNHLPYGKNRRLLEHLISNRFNTHIIRLSSLIHSTITKNPLFDLKHQQYLNNINLNAEIQWYDLNNLNKDISYVVNHNVKEYNLVSEPISNGEIVNKFFPTLSLAANTVVNQTVSPYCYTKEEIFIAMEQYLND